MAKAKSSKSSASKSKEKPTLQVGAIVSLKSGGPQMTVTQIRPTTGKAKCVWFSGIPQEGWGFLEEETFGVDCIEVKQ